MFGRIYPEGQPSRAEAKVAK
jgi:ADP-ribose pyrophosphatase YjhB (NUDIX family)